MPESSRTPAHGRRQPVSLTISVPELLKGSKEDKVEYVLTDPTAGNAARNRGGAKILEPRSSSCCQRSLLSLFSLVPHIVTASCMIWDSGSLFLRRCGVLLVSFCGSGSLLPQRRCGVPDAVCCGSSNPSLRRQSSLRCLRSLS